VEQHSGDVVAQKGKAQFGGMEDERVPAKREAGLQIPRAGLIVGKAAMPNGRIQPN
jgi:hypothetical protein